MRLTALDWLIVILSIAVSFLPAILLARRAGLAWGDFVEGFLSLILSGEVNSFAVRRPNDFIHAAVKRFGQFNMFSAGAVVSAAVTLGMSLSGLSARQNADGGPFDFPPQRVAQGRLSSAPHPPKQPFSRNSESDTGVSSSTAFNRKTLCS